MVVKIERISNTYQDSVKLMRIASDVKTEYFLDEAAAMMGTSENKQSLIELGLLEDDDLADLGPDDLILAVEDEDPETAEKAIAEMESEISGSQAQQEEGGTREAALPKSLYSAIARMPDSNLALISVPGAYATREAWKALHEGLDVHIFSDNVPIEDERKLKAFGEANDRLVMGPDSGTAIINQAPLGFANDVSEGSIGLVSAAGSGLQEVTALIDRAGAGITQAIGTGGRDLKDEVGGIAMRQGIDLLTEDEETDVIVLISKPPEEETMETVLDSIEDCPKPVVVEFIGSDASSVQGTGGIAADSLADAARLAVAEVGDGSVDDVSFADGVDAFTSPDAAATIVDEAGVPPADRRYVRGLFSGGTLSSEAVTILEERTDVASNIGIGDPLDDALDPRGNAVVDLGADEFTMGRPHPMIDSDIRDEQLRSALESDDVLVVLLDVILGYGAHEDPAGTVADVIEDVDPGEWPLVVASVVGTRGDPQGWEEQIETLTEAGVYVTESNADAAELTTDVLRQAANEGGDQR